MIVHKIDSAYQVALMDVSEIREVARRNGKWMNFQLGIHRDISIPEFERLSEIGEPRYVERANAIMSQIEDQIPLSRGWRNLDDVVGSVPNVPSYLAGHPQCMRRRERVARENAPLTIFMNLNSTMSIPAYLILKRGIVLLALTRLLATQRPVELWVGTGLSDGRRSAAVGWKIDTAPMDLARAAFQIADVNMSRLFGYATCEMLTNCHLGGGYGTGGYRDNEILEQHLRQAAGWTDVLFIPNILSVDKMVSEPVGWLRDKMRRYVRQEDDETEERE